MSLFCEVETVCLKAYFVVPRKCDHCGVILECRYHQVPAVAYARTLIIYFSISQEATSRSLDEIRVMTDNIGSAGLKLDVPPNTILDAYI